MRGGWRAVRGIVNTGIWVAVTIAVVRPAPALELADWSNSKTKDRRIMFVAEPGDVITLTVNVRGAKVYLWTINKAPVRGQAAAGAQSGSLSFTVPAEKGIWEIHVTATDGTGGEPVHHEWVVSTLAAAEAPELFEYFTDRRFAKRAERDPWGRPLTEWRAWAIAADWTEWQELWHFLPGGQWGKGYGPWYEKLKALDTSCCFLQAPAIAPEPNYARHLLTLLTAETGIEFGTWRFRFRFPNGRTEMAGGKTHLRFYFAHVSGYYWYPFWYGVACDGFNAFRVAGSAFDEGATFPVDKAWHEVTVIRTAENELYSFVDGQFQFRGKTARRTPEEDVTLKIGLARFQPDRYPADTVYVDCVEAYKGRYLFPSGWNTAPALAAVAGAESDPAGRHIVVRGRHVRLQEIARAIDDPGLFRYHAASARAICSVNLAVDRGSDLLLTGQTLQFQPARGHSCTLAVQPKATLRADKSRILNARLVLDQPFDVNLNETRLEGFRKLELSLLPCTSGSWQFHRVTLATESPLPELLIRLPDNNVRLNLYNSDLGNATVKLSLTHGSGTVLGLVNCRFGQLKPLPEAWIVTKYFLDVRVVDAGGRPVSRARVAVRNEADDINFPAENWEEFQPHGGGRTAYLNEAVLPRLISYAPKRFTFTNADGHTPPPEDRQNTLIIADFVQNERSRTEFRYRIDAIAPDGRQGRVAAVNPGPDWYRQDPNQRTHTVTVVAIK